MTSKKTVKRPASKKAAPPKGLSRFTTKRNIKIASLVVVAILAGVIAYRMHVHEVKVNKQFAQDKTRFAKTEKNMAAAYAAITKQLGPPFDSAHGVGCSYGALKYNRGPLSCSVYYVFSFQYKDLNQPKADGQDALSVINDMKLYGPVKVREIPSWPGERIGDYEAYYNHISNFNCFLDKNTFSLDDYNKFRDNSLHLKAVDPYVSMYLFECDGSPVKPLYPLSSSTE